ncbi:MAG TPA: glucan biosynthesis protein [Victivallales bacterium]|nr:glucan biosynthesis protein [Victivallales bacterium]
MSIKSGFNKIVTLVILLSIFVFYSSKSFSTPKACQNNFTYKNVVKIAENLSKKPFKPRVSNLPESVKNLTYSQYNMINFKQKNGLWTKDKLPFMINFFPLGTKLYTVPVELNEIINGKATKIPYDQNNFTYYGPVVFAQKAMPIDAGYAGFQIVHNDSAGSPEFAVFLGNSYFRILSKGSSYGLSARGIAINTGLEGVSEEFPAFTKYWLKKPAKDDKCLIIYAILEGKSITGAYHFTLTPGETAVVKIKSTLYLRNKVELLGLSPLTSMYWFDEYTNYHFNDYRPQVHNSEGLIISKNKGSDIIWKPLVNYPKHKMNNNDTKTITPDYYGLIQRTRGYNNYMDPLVRYHLNPSAWIIPNNDWKSGTVRLFQLQTTNEWLDNINTFWMPDNYPEIGKPYNFDYTIFFSLKEPNEKLAYVKFTNSGLKELSSQMEKLGNQDSVFVLSYAGNEIKKTNIKVKLEVSDGVNIVQHPEAKYISDNNTLRVLFILKANQLSYSDNPYILKCTLFKDNKQISETWYYQWYPRIQ